MNNYLVHFRTVVKGSKSQTYHTIAAVDIDHAREVADRLADKLPGDVEVLTVQEV